MICHVTLSKIIDICLSLVESERQKFLVLKLESDRLDQFDKFNHVLSERDGGPSVLLFQFALQQIGALSQYEGICLLDVVIEDSVTFDVCINFSFKNHVGDRFQ